MRLKELFLKLRNGLNFQQYYINPNMRLSSLVFQKIGVLLNFLFSLPEMFLYRSALTGLRKIRESKSDRTALLIANGPSSANLNFKRIKDEIQSGNLEIYLINFSILDEDFLELNPNYVVLSDEATKPDVESLRNKELWDLLSSLKSTQVITPMLWHGKFKQLSCENFSCLHFVDVSLIGWTDNCSPMYPYGYVPLTAYKALSVASYMGYSEILISGYDNSMFRSISVDSKNRIIEGPNHSSETYRDSHDLTKLFENGIADYFYGLSLSFLSLRKAFGNFKITNLGIDSEVDCFPKISSSSKWSFLVNE